MENGNAALKLENNSDQCYSPYVYVGNNPISYIDPDGRTSLLGPLVEARRMQRYAIQRSRYYRYFQEQLWNLRTLNNGYFSEPILTKLIKELKEKIETLKPRVRMKSQGVLTGFWIRGTRGGWDYNLYQDANGNSLGFWSNIEMENIERETLWDLNNTSEIESDNAILSPDYCTLADGTPVVYASAAETILIQGMVIHSVATLEPIDKETTDAAAVEIQNFIEDSNKVNQALFTAFVVLPLVQLYNTMFPETETEQPTVENAKEKALNSSGVDSQNSDETKVSTDKVTKQPKSVDRIERDRTARKDRHAHGKKDKWAINEDGTAHDKNFGRIPKDAAEYLRYKGFNIPVDRYPLPNK